VTPIAAVVFGSADPSLVPFPGLAIQRSHGEESDQLVGALGSPGAVSALVHRM
jgi:hypothetical protein